MLPLKVVRIRSGRGDPELLESPYQISLTITISVVSLPFVIPVSLTSRQVRPLASAFLVITLELSCRSI
jgi:hypothetical protein